MHNSQSFAERITDAAEKCLQSGAPFFTRFLTEDEQAALSGISFVKGVTAVLCGGVENKEPIRSCLGLFPSEYFPQGFSLCGYDKAVASYFPIKAVNFTFRKGSQLRHSDILGAVMALGLKRDALGDIFIEDGKAVLFAYEKIADYIADNTAKLGKVGVTAKMALSADFALPCRSYEQLCFSVASLRLDNVVKCLANSARGNAVDRYIATGFTRLNGNECHDSSKQLKQGDIVSVRGKGKFLIDAVGEKTPKGRIHITVKKYV